MPLDTYLTIAGAISALLLIAGLVASIAARGDEDAWRVWPVPPVRSLKSFIFWTLFRTLNVIVLLLAAERALALAVAGALPAIRLLLLIVSFAAFDAYLYALWALGREATYCRASGLATEGIYRWTRNPPYTTAIAAFSALGFAVWPLPASSLAAALVLVYALMAVAEEPWLEARYGGAYADYRASVPRFFNFRHAAGELAALASRRSQSLASQHHDGR
jgi:protein-S-isoprenylcysteine O-methyltransferase Ste14